MRKTQTYHRQTLPKNAHKSPSKKMKRSVMVLQAPSAAAKQEWIEAFRRENRKVTADRTRGIRTLNAEELAAAENDDAQDLAARRKTLVSKMSGLSLRRKQRK